MNTNRTLKVNKIGRNDIVDKNRIKLVNKKLFLCLLLASIFYIGGLAAVMKEGNYSKSGLAVFIVMFAILCCSFVAGNFLKGYVPAILMVTSFVFTTLAIAFLFNSCIVLAYLLVVLVLITSYQNAFLMYYVFLLTIGAAFFGQYYGMKQLGWQYKDVSLVPFIVMVDILSVFLSYKQIVNDNAKQKEFIMEKQEKAETSYENLVNLSQVVSENTSQLVLKARDNRDETQSVLECVSGIVEGLADQNNTISMQVENSQKIQSKLEEVTDYVATMNEHVDKVILLATKSGKNMSRLNDNTEHVNKIAAKSKTGINDLLKQVTLVQGVVEIITEVAEQTRLLSLNASIEAAKAGIYGNGFNVVAEEIRKLSDSTSESVKKINNLLSMLQDKTSVVDNEIEEMNGAFGQQQVEISMTNNNMDELVEAMNELRSGLDNVVNSTNEVVNSNAAVAKGITNIAAISEEISATIDEVSVACKHVFESSSETLNIAETVEKRASQLS